MELGKSVFLGNGTQNGFGLPSDGIVTRVDLEIEIQIQILRNPHFDHRVEPDVDAKNEGVCDKEDGSLEQLRLEGESSNVDGLSNQGSGEVFSLVPEISRSEQRLMHIECQIIH